MNPETAGLFLPSCCRNSLGRLRVCLGASSMGRPLSRGSWENTQLLIAGASSLCQHHMQFLMAARSPGRRKQLCHLLPSSALWWLSFIAAVWALCASLAEQRRICAFKGNVSLPHCCLKMQRGISAPNGLRLKIKIGEVRSSTSVDCLGFSGVSARTPLLPFP